MGGKSSSSCALDRFAPHIGDEAKSKSDTKADTVVITTICIGIRLMSSEKAKRHARSYGREHEISLLLKLSDQHWICVQQHLFRKLHVTRHPILSGAAGEVGLETPTWE